MDASRHVGAGLGNTRGAALQNFDPEMLNAVLEGCFEAITAAGRAELSLRTILLFGAVFAGTSRVDLPDTRPYGDG